MSKDSSIRREKQVFLTFFRSTKAAFGFRTDKFAIPRRKYAWRNSASAGINGSSRETRHSGADKEDRSHLDGPVIEFDSSSSIGDREAMFFQL